LHTRRWRGGLWYRAPSGLVERATSPRQVGVPAGRKKRTAQLRHGARIRPGEHACQSRAADRKTGGPHHWLPGVNLEDPKTFRDDIGTFVVRVCFPLSLFFGAYTILLPSEKRGALVLAALLVLWGIFYATATVVQVDESGVRYRRYYRWTKVSYDEILECRLSWIPAVGFIKLARFVPPWGKIYFVPVGPPEWLHIFSQHSKMTRYIDDAARAKRSTGGGT
jgi:hypothetical protein